MNRDGSEDLLWLGWLASAAMFCWAAALAIPRLAVTDLPAWVQAIGSVAAIIATGWVAVWADQGAARRQQAELAASRADELRRAAQAVTDWQRLLRTAVETLENVARDTDRALHPDNVDPQRAIRTLANMAKTIDLYLAQSPPNEHLAWALTAVRTEFDAPMAGVRDYSAKPGNGTPFFEMAMLTADAAKIAREVVVEYEGGVR